MNFSNKMSFSAQNAFFGEKCLFHPLDR